MAERRLLENLLDRLAGLLAASMSVFAIYVAGFGVFDNIVVSGLTVLLAATYGYAAWRRIDTPAWILLGHFSLLIVFAVLVYLWSDLMFRQ